MKRLIGQSVQIGYGIETPSGNRGLRGTVLEEKGGHYLIELARGMAVFVGVGELIEEGAPTEPPLPEYDAHWNWKYISGFAACMGLLVGYLLGRFT